MEGLSAFFLYNRQTEKGRSRDGFFPFSILLCSGMLRSDNSLRHHCLGNL